ncbi:MAG: DUF523 domain-containing protein [Eubacterium sp.]|nr:DUF523 domain-containing protein [Eubacterium sp.]
MKTKLIVSACLLGENCKYNGGNNYNSDILKLKTFFELIPVCPEAFGGLEIPREPCEIRERRVYSKSGEDFTSEFERGAEHTLYIAKECNAPVAILKENSPSCGCGKIYDGSFSGRLCDGNGITAQLLLDNDIAVFGDSRVKKLIELYGIYD